MTDGSYECGMIMERLDSIQRSIDEQRSYVREKFDESSERVDNIEHTVNGLAADRNKAFGAAQGAGRVLATIGGMVVTLFTLIGWVAINGIPDFIKRAFQ